MNTLPFGVKAATVLNTPFTNVNLINLIKEKRYKKLTKKVQN